MHAEKISAFSFVHLYFNICKFNTQKFLWCYSWNEISENVRCHFLATSHSSHLTLKKNLCWNGKKFLLVSQINHFMSFLSQMCACIIKIFIVWITSKIKYSKSCSNLLSFSLLPHSQSLIHLLSLLTVHKHINVVTSNTARKYFLINPGGNFKERDTNCSTTRTRFKCVRHKKRSFLWILKN